MQAYLELTEMDKGVFVSHRLAMKINKTGIAEKCLEKVTLFCVHMFE